MADIISEKDPRGIHVICSERQWAEHIIAGHSLMADNVESVAKTIRDPDVIYESHDSEPPLDYREVYVKKEKSATYYNSKAPYTKVVTSTLGGAAEIITAFNAKSLFGGMIEGEEAIYIAERESEI
nr:MAG TPA: nuclease [Caudoviricetes sp.]